MTDPLADVIDKVLKASIPWQDLRCLLTSNIKAHIASVLTAELRNWTPNSGASFAIDNLRAALLPPTEEKKHG